MFNISGEYEGTNTFTLSSGRYEISSSPFINVTGNNVRGRINFNYSHFKRNALPMNLKLYLLIQTMDLMALVV